MKIRNEKINATVEFTTINGVMMAKANKAGVFTAINRNYGGKTLYFNTKDEGNFVFGKLRSLGYEVLKEAPKERKVPENRIIWSKDGRKIWACQRDHLRKLYLPAIANLRGKEYHEARMKIEKRVTEEMKVWEAENAPKINAFLQNVVWKIAK